MSSNIRLLSTRTLNDTLSDIIDNPKNWLKNKGLISALKSQRKLAKWEDVELRIRSCSLNTLKTSANRVLSDGFDGMDARRIKALSKIEKETTKGLAPKPGSRTYLEAKVKLKTTQIAVLEARNMTLTYYIRELQSLIENGIHSCSSQEVRIRNQRQLEIIHAKLSASGESSLVVEVSEPNGT
jgi:hypothetical protein